MVKIAPPPPPLLLLVLSAYWCITAAEPRSSVGCGSDLPHGIHPGHSHDFSVVVEDPVMGSVNRNYRLHVPANYNKDVAAPLVVDYHGWTGNSHSQERYSHFVEVADMEEGGFLVATPDGMGDAPGGSMGSFNCSRTDGPLGPPCDPDRTRWGEITCYDSCPLCDPLNSCDWSSCYDDIAFTRAMITAVSDAFCVDENSIHQSGISNGGLFSYFMVSKLSDIFASIAPLAAAPLVGFGDLPPTPMSLIDIHGINDDTIPIDMEHAEGEGPHASVISWDGYYYEEKKDILNKWYTGMNCDVEPSRWETDMDGVDGWSCQVWSNCDNGVEVVSCTANHGHDYPFGSTNQYVEGARIMAGFMKSHAKE